MTEEIQNEEIKDPFMDLLSLVLNKSLERYSNVTFTLNNMDLNINLLTEKNGLIGVWVFQLDKVYKEMMGIENSGLYYYADPNSVCEATPAYDNNTINKHANILLLCANFTVDNIINKFYLNYEKENHFKTHGPVKMGIESIYNEWYDAMTQGEIAYSNEYRSEPTNKFH